jgi:hypothetical protein
MTYWRIVIPRYKTVHSDAATSSSTKVSLPFTTPLPVSAAGTVTAIAMLTATRVRQETIRASRRSPSPQPGSAIWLPLRKET